MLLRKSVYASKGLHAGICIATGVMLLFLPIETKNRDLGVSSCVLCVCVCVCVCVCACVCACVCVCVCVCVVKYLSPTAQYGTRGGCRGCRLNENCSFGEVAWP